ncbi:hypothetical protein PpSQ1_26720, partial [Pseudomonas putida]
QFEWFCLLHPSALLRATPLYASIDRAFGYAEQCGVKDAAVLAMLAVDGQVIDATQRIWAQAEYLRALALRAGSEMKVAEQLQAMEQRFLHDGGWSEAPAIVANFARP